MVSGFLLGKKSLDVKLKEKPWGTTEVYIKDSPTRVGRPHWVDFVIYSKDVNSHWLHRLEEQDQRFAPTSRIGQSILETG